MPYTFAEDPGTARYYCYIGCGNGYDKQRLMWHLSSDHTEDGLKNWGLKKDVLRQQAECVRRAAQKKGKADIERKRGLRREEKAQLKAMLNHGPDGALLAELKAENK